MTRLPHARPIRHDLTCRQCWPWHRLLVASLGEGIVFLALVFALVALAFIGSEASR